MSKYSVVLLAAIGILLTACFSTEEPEMTSAQETEMSLSTATSFQNTLPPVTTEPMTPDTASDVGTSTPVPEPTVIAPPTVAETPGTSVNTTPNTSVTSGPGISLSETLGTPEQSIIVTGQGFEPSELITLHWGPADGPIGPASSTVDAGEDGSFEITLDVPSAENWPGGNAEEEEFIQLRAKSESWADTEYFWANFRYIIRYNPNAAVLPYSNTVYGYSLTLPNNWEWTWEDDDTSNVRFNGPTGSGFVRVVGTTDVIEALQQVISSEFPGANYTTAIGGLGAYPATQAITDGGVKILAIPSGQRIYVLSFTTTDGQPADSILQTFSLQ